jgi:formate hydrogenlyase subunit 3/multisubunit Na+/H+ antiporter MnhD subunit
LTLVYTFLTGMRIFFGPQRTAAVASMPGDPPASMSWPLLGLAVVALAIGLYPDPLLRMIGTVVTGG